MDEDRADQSLRDELALAIERALAIDPDPALKVRVRARIDLERTRHGWWQRWRRVSVAAGVAALAIVVALVVSGARPPAPGLVTREAVVVPPESPVQKPAAVQPVISDDRPVRPPAPAGGRRSSSRPVEPVGPVEPKVLVPRDQAPALHLLTASLREGRLDPSVLDGVRPADGALRPLQEISIQPIVITPLARLELLEGAPQ